MGPVRPRGVCGTPEAVAARVAHAPVRSTGTPSVVERDHLTQHQRHRRCTRRPHGDSTELTGCETPLKAMEYVKYYTYTAFSSAGRVGHALPCMA